MLGQHLKKNLKESQLGSNRRPRGHSVDFEAYPEHIFI